ncbi:MAG: PAS domain S-box protein [Campylobacteraceae bacterium]|nr:PAS domain S-box protein [Campylobacteraceae bacterium]
MHKSKLQQYQDAIDASNIVSKTDKNGFITFVNDEFCQISKYKREELIGRAHNIIRHPDVDEAVFKKLWETILDKKVYRGVIKSRAKDGSAFYLNATIIPMLDENDEIDEFVAIRHDVTEIFNLNERLKETQEELRELNLSLEDKVHTQTKELLKLNKTLEKRVEEEVLKNEEKNRLLAEQSKLASMGEMIGHIAHQWRQPLSELSIALFKLKQEMADEESFLKTYEHSKSIIKSMSNTIDDFRNFFKTDKEKEYFFIEDAVNDALRLLKGSFQKHNLKVEIQKDDGAKIYGIKSELFQILVNLLNNAKDALKESGEENIKITIKKDSKFAYVSVFNAGKPIDDKILDKIFEPYFTTKHQSVGTGLGLYMSRVIAQNMNSKLSARNLQNGVEFLIKIPIERSIDA